MKKDWTEVLRSAYKIACASIQTEQTFCHLPTGYPVNAQRLNRLFVICLQDSLWMHKDYKVLSFAYKPGSRSTKATHCFTFVYRLGCHSPKTDHCFCHLPKSTKTRVNVLKFQTLYSIFSWPKVCFFLSLKLFLKILSRMANSISLIRLLLQKQSDLGLHCLHA